MIERRLTKEEKEECRAHFKDYKLPKGKIPKHIVNDIVEGYSAIFRGVAEMPAINMMPECKHEDDSTDVYARILLQCIQKGNPYRYPKELLDEWKRLEELGYPYD